MFGAAAPPSCFDSRPSARPLPRQHQRLATRATRLHGIYQQRFGDQKKDQSSWLLLYVARAHYTNRLPAPQRLDATGPCGITTPAIVQIRLRARFNHAVTNLQRQAGRRSPWRTGFGFALRSAAANDVARYQAFA